MALCEVLQGDADQQTISVLLEMTLVTTRYFTVQTDTMTLHASNKHSSMAVLCITILLVDTLKSLMFIEVFDVVNVIAVNVRSRH